MDVRFSPEQRALQDAATKLATDLAPRTVRDLDDSERVAYKDLSELDRFVLHRLHGPTRRDQIQSCQLHSRRSR